jgi:hypothetical protein
VVVDDLDMRRSSLILNKTDAPLVVDADRVLSQTIRSQGFQTVAWRHAQIVQDACLIQKTQFSQRDILDIRR